MEYVSACKEGVLIDCAVKVNAKNTRISCIGDVALEVQVGFYD